MTGVSFSLHRWCKVLSFLSAIAIGGAAKADVLTYQIIDLGTLGGTSSDGSSVNNRGQVTGQARTTGDSSAHAYLKDLHGAMQDLGTLGGLYSGGAGINDSGQVVGGSNTTNNAQQHAFLKNPGSPMQDIGTLGGTSSFASGINKSGQVVGTAALAGDYSDHAFRRDVDGVMHDLGTLGGNLSIGHGINDSGQITGVADLPSGSGHAFLTDSTGQMQDLGGQHWLCSEQPRAGHRQFEYPHLNRRPCFLEKSRRSDAGSGDVARRIVQRRIWN
jgi:probable HAF family extracellular repeat protein